MGVALVGLIASPVVLAWSAAAEVVYHDVRYSIGVAGETALGDGALVDGNGQLQGPEAWNAWTGGDAPGGFYTCRLAVDGEVVAEETMKGLCSAQYRRRV